jgi:hypothetical protein
MGRLSTNDYQQAASTIIFRQAAPASGCQLLHIICGILEALLVDRLGDKPVFKGKGMSCQLLTPFILLLH